MVIGKTGGLGAFLSSREDERSDTPGRLEKGLEGVLFLSLHLETIPLELPSHPGQSLRLLSFSTHAASVHKEENPGGSPEIPQGLLLIAIHRLGF